MARFKKRKLSKKEAAAIKKQEDFSAADREDFPLEQTKVQSKSRKMIVLPPVVSVKELSSKMDLPVTTIISALMKNGVLANINQSVDFDTAQIIGDDLGFDIEAVKGEEVIVETEKSESIVDQKNLLSRPPIVAIMGHVDHGKTSLLDKIRSSNIAAGESGGITQHISAFQIKVNSKKAKGRLITFIDTPGHEAFSAMRSHGTAITDIVILIVAADDGVMPQTIEVIEQSKKNNVPIIVAINKVDKPAADPNKVKQQLTEYQLTPEEWGGETIFVETSAETGKGIDDLLEAIAIFADMKNYRANPNEKATGVVIESFMQKGSGPVATILIENGSLKKGDPIVIGNQWGRVRILQDTLEKDIDSALPGMPIRIAGLRGLPNFGDRLLVVESEKEAKNQAQIDLHQPQAIDFVSARRLSSDDQTEDKVVELNLVVKADVKGSLGAIKKLFNDINHPEVKIKIVHEGIGPISESDVNMAKASSAIVVGFRVKILAVARKLAELEAVKIYHQTIIYDLLKKIKEEMSVLLPAETVEETLGKLKVLAIFRYDKKKTIFGGIVEEGEINRKDRIKILRGQKEIYRGEIKALRHGKDETSSVGSGSECGISVDGLVDVIKDDLAIAFKEQIIKKVVE